MDKAIRVLCVFSCLDRGGAETMCMNLYRSIDRNKVQFDFVKHTQKIGAYEEEIATMGGRIFTAPKLRLTNYREYAKWWKKHFIEHSEHNIIHIYFFTVTAAITPILHKYKKIVVGHCHTSFGSSSVKKVAEKAVIRIGGAKVDYALACSDKAGSFMFGKRKYHLLKNAVDTKLFEYDPTTRQKCRDEFSLNGVTIIGHIGRFTPVKNHRFLLEVFSALKEKKENVKLMLVGDGHLHDEIEKYAEQLGVLDDVIFMGVRSDVNELVQAMDFFVFPSLFEGLPVTLVEVQTSGLPCVISDTVSNEAILTKDLVTAMSLNESAEKWADAIIARSGEKRCSRVDEVRENGYDILETAKWLENFYFSISDSKR